MASTAPTNTKATSNTPQAKDDVVATFEAGELISIAALMANDAGGNGKSFYGIHGSTTTSWGARLTVENGAIRYDGSSSAQLQALAQGESVTDTFQYAIQLGKGVISIATVTVTVTGTNDGPVAVADTGATTENQAVVIDALANDTDLDHGAVKSLVSVDAPKGAARIEDGRIVFDPGTAFDHLAEGATETVALSYTMTDEHGARSSSTITITVTGTNDGPVAVADAVATTENQSILIDALANDSDVDDGASKSLVSVDVPAGKGRVAVVDGQILFDPGSDFDHLAYGATEIVTLAYVMADEHGATSTSTVTLTVTGTNDAPHVGGVVTGTAVEDGPAVALDALAAASDLDDGASLSVVAPALLPDGVSFDSATQRFTLDPTSAAYQALAAGETLVVAIDYLITDGIDSTPASLSWTVTGTNDGPTVTSGEADARGAVVEAGSQNNGAPSASGTLSAADVDHGASATWSGNANGVYGHFAIDASGVWTYTLDNDAPATQALSEGQLVIETFTATVTDDQGATATQTITVEVTGAIDNRAPTVSNISQGVGEDGSVKRGFVGDDIDPDDSPTTLTYEVVSQPAAGTLVNHNDGTFSFTPGSAFQDLALGQSRQVSFTYRAIDSHGAASTPATVTLTVTGANDGPVITSTTAASTGSVIEAGALDDRTVVAGTPSATGTLTATDVDAGSSRSWSLASAGAGTYGNFAIAGNGQWTYTLDNAKAATQGLNEGQTVTETFTARVTDNDGASVTQTVTLTIAGTNDAPTVSNVTATGTGSVVGFVVGDQVVLALADSNGDGSVDRVSSSSPLGQIYGEGTATGDIDGDGDVDIVRANYSTVTIHTNRGDTNGDGRPDFAASTISTAGASSDVALGDLNADGRLDIVLAGQSGNLIELINTGDTNGNGLIDNFSSRTVTGATGDFNSYGMAVADLNGDGRADIMQSAYSAGPVTIRYNLGDTNGDGKLDYRVQQVEDAYDESTMGIATGDVDGDGRIDMLLSRWNGQNEVIYLNRGDSNNDGLNEFTTIELPTGGSTMLAKLADIDGDGDLDAILPSYDGISSIKIAFNQGDLNGDGKPDFTIRTISGAPVYSIGLAVGDADGDGDQDIIVPSYGSSGVGFLENRGDTNGDGFADFTARLLSNATAVNSWDAEFLVQGGTTGGSGPREDGPAVTIAFKGDDADADDSGATLSYQILSQPSEGSVTNNGDGTFSFDPGSAFQDLGAGQARTVSFTYQATDSHGAVAAPATVTISVAGTNDGPVITSSAAASSGSVAEAGHFDNGQVNAGVPTATGMLTSTDVDAGSTATWSIVGSNVGTYGSLALTSAGVWTYTLNNASSATQSLDEGQAVTESFTVRVTDGAGASATQTVALTVNGTNDQPIAVADSASTNEDTAITLNLRANDADPDGAAPTVVAVQALSQRGATLTLNPDGTVSYDPSAAASLQALGRNQSVVDSFTYTVRDAEGAESTATVNVTVAGALEPPTARADTTTTGENMTAAGNVLANDSFTGATSSTGNVLVNGSFEQGSPTVPGGVGYAASLPGWTAPGGFEVWGTGFSGNIASNGSFFVELDNGGAQDIYSQTLATQAGREYSISFDLAQRSGTAASSNMVQFLVNGVVVGTFTPTTTTFQTFSVNFVATGNDVIAFREPASANDGLGGLIDNLRIEADADVFITAVNGQGANVGQSVAGSNGGTFKVAVDGSYSFDPGSAFNHLAAGQTATSSVSYTVTDDGGQSTSTITVTITGANDGPVAVADAATTTENQAVSINALANDTDVDAGDSKSLVSASVAKGSVSIVDGQIRFDPGTSFDHLAAGGTEKVTVSYTMRDAAGVTSSSMAVVTVTGTNDAPHVTATAPLPLVEAGTSAAGVATSVASLAKGDVDGTASYDLGGWSQVGATTYSKAGTYGSVLLDTSADTLTYHLDNSDPDTQALVAGQTVSESFSVSVTDGQASASQSVSFAIQGAADIVANSFETGFDGWATIGSAGRTSGGALTGDWKLSLFGDGASDSSIESFLGIAQGTLDAVGNGDATVGSAALKTVFLKAGETFSMQWYFDPTDPNPSDYNDFAFARNPNGTVVELADQFSNGDHWVEYRYTATSAGNYSFGFGTINVNDQSFSSLLHLDGQLPLV
jgi:VCBS repeat-containing protein